MADVFISYQRQDREICERIATALERNFFSVWWDDQLHPRESWDRIIEREIEAAKAVVVLWTPHAVQSDWVREEARYAKDRQKLVPARMSPCSIPLGFGSVQTENLEAWSGEADDAHWLRFISWIEALVGPRVPTQSINARRDVTVVPVYKWADLASIAEHRRAQGATKPSDSVIVRRARMSKYKPLSDFLRSARPNLPVKMSFREIEKVLESKLPDSAGRDRSWWANTSHGSHVQARAWLDVGCVIDDVNFETGHVIFALDPKYRG